MVNLIEDGMAMVLEFGLCLNLTPKSKLMQRILSDFWISGENMNPCFQPSFFLLVKSLEL
jgi:hypothetical protein